MFILTLDDMLDAFDGVAYAIDLDGALIAIGRDRWQAFARENGGDAISDSRSLIGRSLFDFIAGDGVRRFYRRLVADIREGRESAVVLPARCDGPGIRREARLTLTPLRTGGEMRAIVFHAQTLGAEMRPPINIYDLAALDAVLKQHQALPILFLCSLCNDVWRPAGEDVGWITVERYYELGGDDNVRIGHVVCPDCAAEVAR